MPTDQIYLDGADGRSLPDVIPVDSVKKGQFLDLVKRLDSKLGIVTKTGNKIKTLLEFQENVCLSNF